ncbi:MAG TPA: hypothetical protein VK629_00145 [Steroidobacteraceae bacterium]|nr:hypothetical protein [Steroidobacteraceae bacterium]
MPHAEPLWLRYTLWVSAAFNVFAALLFAFPASQLGQQIGLPADAPLIYRSMLTFLILLFGGSYAWLATQSVIHRPLLALSAIGKFGVFWIVLVLWLLGQATLRGFIAAIGDLVLSLCFAGWLISTYGKRGRSI